ncbi:MAG: tRNA (adenosine(37)-N6)-threonylcarbamoyltransferase complex transferase subunit TsaD, partial [Lentisphaerae bacterium]|nr:tRNA (adenosine(37)-N6)-threonylcarbamoyltransferase complex transferase subunit TsaD [Lentisphaerota bacterium]
MNNVFGIETSCDETAAAVAADAVTIKSSVIDSQAAKHAPYGGVVPEIAARNHITALPRVIRQAREQSGIAWESIQAVAVTYGPGLATSLLTGIAAAKGLALRLRVPLIGINHLEAHLYSVFLAPEAPSWQSCMPFAALIVSGGHTCLLRVDAPGCYQSLGATLDDAAGEAFDKGAQLLGLGYPGGPIIDHTARAGRADAIRFPRGRIRGSTRLDFSFSGLKTALRYHLEKRPEPPAAAAVADIAAGYQEAIVDV